MGKNSGSLPQNEVSFGSDLLAKFVAFTQKNESTIQTFIVNWGYHLEEQVKVSTLAPRTASGLVGEPRSNAVNAWLSHTHYTCLLRYSPTPAKLASHILPPFVLKGPACVVVRPPETCDHGRLWGPKKERSWGREGKRELGREEWAKKKERGMMAWQRERKCSHWISISVMLEKAEGIGRETRGRDPFSFSLHLTGPRWSSR